MPSLMHRISGLALRMQGFPDKFGDMVGGSGLKRHWPSKRLIRKHHVRQKDFEGFPFLWFDPISGEREPGVIIALHGGGYVVEAAPEHLKAYAKLAEMSGRRVYAPYYPLAPEHGPEAIFAWTKRFSNHVVAHVDGEPLYLTGDSAGANLALHMLRDGVKAERMVLWSPWVDVEMANPALVAQDGKCRLLGSNTIETIAGTFAGDVDRRKLSPLFWESEDLPPTLVLSGDFDLLHPDILRYAELRDEVVLDTAPKMHHDYMILPTREARAALQRTVEFLFKG